MMVGSGMPPRDGDSLEELAAIAALEGKGVLSETQRALVDDERVRELEHAAGALFSALVRSRDEQVPDSALSRLEDVLSTQASADAHEARHRGSSHHHDTLRDVPQRQPQAASEPEPETLAGPATSRLALSANTSAQPASAVREGTGRLSVLSGWLAAAALLIATVVSYGRILSLENQLGLGPAESTRGDLIATAPDVELLPWVTEGVAGDVAWSDARNEGFMRIDGLAVNDPAVSQYQLWIFRGLDPAAEAHPVSGGVFDVSRDGEVIIPIDAQLKLGRAGVFAVTVERPGGVTVSERESIVLVASRA
ncbi:MAG: anti-sigma factor [Planctomycetota bacterium]|nr:anti-sigma factor [Planctomycetota bacterium]